MSKYNPKDDPELHFSLPKEIMNSNTLSPACKLVLARIWVLSKKGKNVIEMSDPTIKSELGLTINGANKTIKTLEANGYITCNVSMSKKYKGKKSRFVTWVYPTECDFKNDTYTTECDKDIQQSCISEIQQSSSSSIYENENRERIESEKALSINSSAYSLEQIYQTFNKKAKEMSSEYPLIQTMNIKAVADKFYAYKSQNNFSGVKNLSLAVGKWLIDECEHDMKEGKSFSSKPSIAQSLNFLCNLAANEKSTTIGTDCAPKSIAFKEA